MAEGLQSMLGDIAQLQVAPDADIPFLLDLQQRIVIKIHPQLQQGQQAGQGMAPGAAPSSVAGAGAIPGAGAGFAGAGGFPGAGLEGAPPPGLMQGAGMPNVDELRRVLAGNQ